MAPSTYRKLQDKHILAIGGSAGIGYAVAEAALASGANVTISSSSQAKVDTAVSALAADYPDRKIRGLVTDLSKPSVEADLDALFRAAQDAQGPIHHVVFTAADALTIGGLDTLSADKILQVLHMRGVVHLLLAKVAVRYLPQTSASSIVYTGGSVAQKPDKGWSILAFVGGGIASLVKGLAVDLAPVRVNAVQPGYVDTTLWAPMGAEAQANFKKAVEAKIPTGKFAQPEDVAEAFLWLLKDANVTGTIAASDGGQLLV
ncbi:NAD(P)-binding protein [Thozetella sp. PMI_491]|nr:NAD(P)-binding protein [Thozetella sp. PMI_491]